MESPPAADVGRMDSSLEEEEERERERRSGPAVLFWFFVSGD
jgi:hypothetical protein